MGPRAGARSWGPIQSLALAWLVGTAAGLHSPQTWTFIISGALCLFLMMWLAWQRHARQAAGWGLLATCMIAAGWASVDAHYRSSDQLARWVYSEPRIVRVVGVVATPPRLSAPQRGTFAGYSYQPPATLLVLRVQSIETDQVYPARGLLVTRLKEADHRLQQGMRIRAVGWISGFAPPRNPGEEDIAPRLAEHGIAGRLTLTQRDNWELLSDTGWRQQISRWRTWASDQASRSLRLGMQPDARRIGLLETLLLGRWSDQVYDLSEAFERVGLAHLLSISGAHLGILAMLLWGAARLVITRPPRAAVVVLVILLVYLWSIPWTVPIVRAGIMAVLYCSGRALGRQVRGIDTLAIALMVVLIWRPSDLHDGGMQLSFSLVLGMMVFTPAVTQWFAPAQPLRLNETGPEWLRQKLAGYLAVNLVASLLAAPLVAYHFRMVNPLAAFLSLLSVPIATAVLGLGYLKILVGLIFPSAGVLLAGPTQWTADTVINLVEHAGSWPGAYLSLAQAPSLVWVAATLGMLVSAFAGWFARRRWALGAAVMLCGLWLMAEQQWVTNPRWPLSEQAPVMKLNMIAVRDGTCVLVRTGPSGPGQRDGHTLLYDCGSQSLSIGEFSIVPALRAMRVSRIDTLIISHADLDHYCAALEVIDAVTVVRVLVPPALIDHAEREPDSATAELVRQLRERGVRLQAVGRGWQEHWGGIEAQLLWPEPDVLMEKSNDNSLVLDLQGAGRRVLLTGDIETQAMQQLIASGQSLHADVTDLSHHGSFLPMSPHWLAAVQPSTVLQSCGPARLQDDPWQELLDQHGITRFITQRDGMVELRVESGGQMRWTTFRNEPGPVPYEP